MPRFSIRRLARLVLPRTVHGIVRETYRHAPGVVRERFDLDGPARRRLVREVFADQRVALVGPSPSIIGLQQGKKLDSYDLVGRLNSALPLDPATAVDLGSRCDVLFSSLYVKPRGIDPGVPVDPDEWLKAGVRQLVCAYPRWHPEFQEHIDAYLDRHPDTLPFAWASRGMHHQQCRQLGARPTTGYAAILYLLDQPIKELFITGFTFMRDGYHKSYRDVTAEASQKLIRHVGVHDPESELQSLRRLCLSDPRIKIDGVLQNIFDTDDPAFIES